jgi:hypothetical protein
LNGIDEDRQTEGGYDKLTAEVNDAAGHDPISELPLLRG